MEGEIGVGLVHLWVLGLVEVVSEGWLESVPCGPFVLLMPSKDLVVMSGCWSEAVSAGR